MEENAQQETIEKKGMSPMIYGIVAVVVLLVVFGGWYLNKKSATMVPPSPSQTMQEPTKSQMKQVEGNNTSISPATPSGEKSNVNEQDITVKGFNFGFDPKTITVKKGQKVKITFTNTGGMHNFVLDDFAVKTDVIPTGQTATVEFTPDKTGTFQYYCSVGSHRAMGMQGTITVN